MVWDPTRAMSCEVCPVVPVCLFPSISFYFNFIFEGTIPSGSLFLHVLQMCQTISLYLPKVFCRPPQRRPRRRMLHQAFLLVSRFALTPTLPALALPCLRRRSLAVTLLRDN